MDDQVLESFYTTTKPDITELKNEYDSDVVDMSPFVAQCQDSYDQRNAIWPGKTEDLQKHGEGAFPWDGASDQEVRLVEQCISTYVSLMMNALNRSNITASPIESSDISEARVKSQFLKWMRDSYIKDFKRQAEIVANNLLEKGIAVTYVDWEMKIRKHKEPINLNDIEQISPELYNILADEEREDEAISLFGRIFDKVDEKAIKKALAELRDIGEAEVPVVKSDISRPFVQTKFADSDIVFPSYVTDIQRSPRVHMRTLMTPSEVENCIETKGWDKDIGRDLIENRRGVNAVSNLSFDVADRRNSNQRGFSFGSSDGREYDDLVEIVHTYRRLIDQKDGAEGIYLTVWSPQYPEGYLSHELLAGYEQYPFVCTKLFNANKRLHDVTNFSDLLRGPQAQAKIVRDGWSDNQAISIAPPFLHPVGRAPTQMGAGAWIGVRQNDTYKFLDVPNTGRQGIEIEEYVQNEALDLVGLNNNNPLSAQRQQFIIDKFLHHISDVLKLAYKAYVVFGPDELYFRVTGQPDPVQFLRSPSDDELDVTVSFDSQNNDPDTVKARVDAFLQLARTSPTNSFDLSKVEQVVASMIDPIIADSVIQPSAQAQQQMMDDVTSDLAKIFAGIPVGAKPNGGEIALQIVQEYIQQPNIQEKLANDPVFAQNLQNYTAKYEQQLAQQRNAEIGRLGAEPAQMGNMNTESI
jgi:hypothetical protein